MEASSSLTNYEYFTFKLSYPFVNISNLVKLNGSRVKTPGVCELMYKNDYELYKIQCHGNRQYKEIPSYFLVPSSIVWDKLY